MPQVELTLMFSPEIARRAMVEAARAQRWTVVDGGADRDALALRRTGENGLPLVRLDVRLTADGASPTRMTFETDAHGPSAGGRGGRLAVQSLLDAVVCSAADLAQHRAGPDGG